jgi:hypothetical protein
MYVKAYATFKGKLHEYLSFTSARLSTNSKTPMLFARYYL